MFKQLSAVLAATSLAAASNPGSARVVNNCPFEVSLWSVGSEISDRHTLAAHGGTYAETYVRDAKTGGRSLKMTRSRNGLLNGDAQTDFAYTLDPDRLFYDLSDVFGDAFAGNRLLVRPSNNNCPSIDWANGIPPAGSQVKTCTRDSDTTLTLCA